MFDQPQRSSFSFLLAIVPLLLVLGAWGCGSEGGDSDPTGNPCISDEECGNDAFWCRQGACTLGQRPTEQGPTGGDDTDGDGDTDEPSGGTDVTPTEDVDGDADGDVDGDGDVDSDADGDTSDTEPLDCPTPTSCECVLPEDCPASFVCTGGFCVPDDGGGSTDNGPVVGDPEYFDPVWMAYHQLASFSGRMRTRVRVLRSDGTGERALFTGYLDEQQATFSPDGTRLAFIGRRSVTEDGSTFDGPRFAVVWDMVTRTLVGEEVPFEVDGERILSASGGAWNGVFSQDGSTVFFTGELGADSPRQLFSLDVASGTITPMQEGPRTLRIGPTSGRLYYSRATNDPTVSEIWWADPDGTNPILRATVQGFFQGEFDVFPDENSALFTYSGDGGQSTQIRRVGFAEGNIGAIITAGNPSDPTILPNGEEVVVRRPRSSDLTQGADLYVHAIDGGAETRRVTNRLGDDVRAIVTRLDAEDAPMENWD